LSCTVIPIVIIDQKPELKDKILKKKKQYKKSQVKPYKQEKTKNNKIKELPIRKSNDGLDIQIIGEEEISRDSVKVLVGDIKVLDMPSSKATKSAVEILKENFNNKVLLEIFEKSDSLNEIVKALDKLELTLFTMEFFDKMDEFEWSDEQKLEFIKDMILFSPRERMEILSSMTERPLIDD
jgi:hypothetical protein